MDVQHRKCGRKLTGDLVGSCPASSSAGIINRMPYAFAAVCSFLSNSSYVWCLMVLGFRCFSEENRNSIINSSLESVVSSNANSFLNSNSSPQPNLNSSDLELEVIKPNRPNSL